MKMLTEKLFLIDGSALAYRSYFAFIKHPLTNSQGTNTSSVFGFINTLLSIIENENPSYLGIVFDTPEPTFRHAKYAEYKATRQKMPEDLAASLPYIEKIVKALGLTYLTAPGYEADDIIGTLVKEASNKKIQSYIVSGDKDFMQLINDQVKMYDVKKSNGISEIGENEVLEKFGVKPQQVIEVLALMGDASDNVPGIHGIGEKTAIQLIQTYASVEQLYEKIETVSKPRIKEILIQQKERALLSRELVIINCNVPLKHHPEDLVFQTPNLPEIRQIFKELEFNLIHRVEKLTEKWAQATEVSSVEIPRSEISKKMIHVKNPANVHLILETQNEIQTMVQKLEQQSLIAIDLEVIETTNFLNQIIGMAIAWGPQNSCYIPFNLNLEEKIIFENLKPLFEHANIYKGGHSIKNLISVFKSPKINIQNPIFDTMLESYLLEASDRDHDLEHLSEKYLNYSKMPIKKLLNDHSVKTIRELAVSDLSKFACENSEIIFKLHQIFDNNLKLNKSLLELYTDVELPLIRILEQMEWDGVTLDLSILSQLSKETKIKLDKLAKHIFEEAGETFKIASPQQLGEILFSKLEIHKKNSEKKPKRNKIGFSTKYATLEAFKGIRIVDLILEYRKLSKLENTYLDVLPTLVHPQNNKIHTSFNQVGTATGRLSSFNPNLQNIPIRDESGKEIRRAFIPSYSTYKIISADYSQIELRVLAHLTGDENLLKAFGHDEDVHAQTASLIFSVPLKEVTHRQRSQAKAINFGIIYGMGPQRLARENGISLEEAKKFIDEYFLKYPTIRSYIQNQIEGARKLKYVTTILGRVRKLPDINSFNPGLKINSEHMAINTPIQGSAADIIKVAMVKIQKGLKEFKTKMLLQVHDELIFETPQNELASVCKMIREEMEHAIQLKVPLKVELGIGNNWLEAH
jgi:DNA polymerase-1